MLLRHRSYPGANLAILALATYMLLLVMPSCANKQELRDLESKVESAGDSLNVNTPALSRSATNSLLGSKRNQRSIYGLGPRMLQISRSKIPIELDLLVDNNDGERSKRFDDYGHMRFGKRGGEEQFDDYGHMRFGRK